MKFGGSRAIPLEFEPYIKGRGCWTRSEPRKPYQEPNIYNKWDHSGYTDFMRPRFPDTLEEMMEEEVRPGVPVFKAEGFADKRSFMVAAVRDEIKRIKAEHSEEGDEE